MRFEPKTDEQIATEGLCPVGWHEAEVISCEEQTSKKGNPMLVVKFKVFSPNGERNMTDWLLPSYPKKLKHFCKAADLLDKYEAGLIEPADLSSCGAIMVEITHEEQTDGKYAGQLQARINDYKAVQRPTKPAQRPAPAAAKTSKPGAFDPFEDENPFNE